MMNKTEYNAEKWLMSRGYKDEDIIFNSLKSPDFLCKDGKRYEAKRIKNNQVFFTPKQVITLLDDDIILIFKDENSKEPFLQILFKEIKNIPITYKGIRFLTWQRLSSVGKSMILYLDKEENDIVVSLAKLWKMSKAETIKKSVRECDRLLKND